MAASSPSFGTVMHADLLGAKAGFVVPDELDRSILHPAAESHFLSDDVKIVLGIPLTHRPRMAIVDDALFKEYLARIMNSATKLDELMAAYEELENSTPGMNRERLHATVQQSVQLISHVKLVPVHVALDGVGRWLNRQTYELERTQSELDTFDDAEDYVSQAGGESTEQDVHEQDVSEVRFREGRASSYSRGGGHGGVKARNVVAVKRPQASSPAQQQIATGTPAADTHALKAAIAIPAQQASVAARAPPDPAEAQDHAELGPLGLLASNLPDLTSLATPAGQGPLAAFNPAAGTTASSFISPEGNKKPQERASGGALAARDMSVPEVNELRTTVAIQSQKLEQMSAKLMESEAAGARAKARTAHLEACLQKQGISIPTCTPEGAAPALTTASAAMAKDPATRSDQQSHTVTTASSVGESEAAGSHHIGHADVQQKTSSTSQAESRGVGQGVKGSRSSKPATASQGQVKPAQASSRSKQTKTQQHNVTKAKTNRSGQEQRSKGGKGDSSPNDMPQTRVGQHGNEDGIMTEDGGSRQSDSVCDEDMPLEETGTVGRTQNSEDSASTLQESVSMLQSQVSELKQTLQEKNAKIVAMQKDMDEMSQALGAAIASVEHSGAAGSPHATPSLALPASQTISKSKTKHGKQSAQTKIKHFKGADEALPAAGTAGPIMDALGDEGPMTASISLSPQESKPSRAPPGEQNNAPISKRKSSDMGTTAHHPDTVEEEAEATTANNDTEGSHRSMCTGPAAHNDLVPASDNATCEEHDGIGGSGPAHSDRRGDMGVVHNPSSLGSTLAHAQTKRTRLQDAAAEPTAEDDAFAGICPRCAELEKHLRYWRERQWFQKAREMKWAKLWARRHEIPVNVSHFAGVLKIADELDNAGSMLGTRRSGGFGRPLSAYIPRALSRRNLSRGRSGRGGAPGKSDDQGLRMVNSLQATGKDDDAHASCPGDDRRIGSWKFLEDIRRQRSGSTAADGPENPEDPSGALAPVTSGITVDTANAALARESARPIRTLTSTTPLSMPRSHPTLQSAPGQIGLTAQAPMVSSHLQDHQGQLFDSRAVRTRAPSPVSEHNGLEPCRVPNTIVTHPGNGTVDVSRGLMERNSQVSMTAAGEVDGRYTGKGNVPTGRSAVSFTVSDHPSLPAAGHQRRVPGTRPNSSAESKPTADHASCLAAASKSVSQRKVTSGDCYAGSDQVRAQSRGHLSRASTHEAPAHGMEDSSITQAVDYSHGASRTSSGSHVPRERPRASHARPHSSDMQVLPLESPFLVRRDPESSGQRITVTGNKLAKPFVRARQEQKVDLASLKLQGMRAQSESKVKTDRSYGGRPERSQRQVASGGRLRNSPRRFQHIAAKRLRSFKLLGSGVRSADGSVASPQ